ncbi:hypothetical protein Ana3638_00180 [Anaerocolumna sedimenticola]|uniref:Uncharacterized protein n=1 Tax=Anaerocolumna sedimenticola TaxID=2696063 RepID=A0A6P1TH59_9FIRM|nr:hypothetical protein [Anaerocolumna sedimenticola]QHQ59409.1 hypothetical protein Ana3638_00180 [Anaerocolumna sedimenticola]
MITLDGKWTMEGLSRNDNNRIKNYKELTGFINSIGFLPLFKNNIKGFSVEELTAADSWWGGNSEEDPWEWRELIAAEGSVAYGKLFNNKAGFVSKEWYPIFAAYRRDGYDFDSRYEDGLASRKCKLIIDVLSEYETLPSYELKAMAGFSSKGEKGFEGAMALLQMQTYITVRDFKRKRNRKNEEYGWPVAIYSLSEKLFGEEYLKSAYHMEAKAAKEEIIKHLLGFFSDASYEEIAKCLK